MTDAVAPPPAHPTQAERAEIFRRLHHGAKPFIMPNPWDVATARLMRALGFEALGTTSAGYAFSNGLRDGVGAVDRAAALAHVKEIAAATVLPVSADLENGYADAPEEVAETVRLAAQAGAVGCSIEDVRPDRAAPVYDRAEAVARIEAAVAAANALDFPFTLTARADGYLAGAYALDEAIARLQAFAAVGAHVVYAPGLQTHDEIARVCAAVEAPVNHVLGLGAPGETYKTLADAGVRRISFGGSLIRVALGAVLRAGREARNGVFDKIEGEHAWGPILTGLKQGTPPPPESV